MIRLFYYFSVDNFSNTYLLGPQGGGEAILIDPGIFDLTLLNTIEDNNYDLKHILVTRASNAHLRGLKTIKKIYDADIYSASPKIFDFECKILKPGTENQLAGIPLEVIPFPELSQDTLLYKFDRWLFCSDILSAGKPCASENEYTTANVMEGVEKRIFPLPEDTMLFPGEGPPTMVKSEKQFNLRLDANNPIRAPFPQI